MWFYLLQHLQTSSGIVLDQQLEEEFSHQHLPENYCPLVLVSNKEKQRVLSTNLRAG